MNLLDRALLSIDMALWRVADFVGVSARRFCDIETVDESGALVTRDGGLVSIMSVGGTGRMLGSDEFDSVVLRLSGQLRSYLGSPAHHLQVVFVRDTSAEAVERELAGMLGGSVATVRRLQLDLDDLIDEQATALGRYCSVEQMYLVAWTSKAALSLVERRMAYAERGTIRAKLPFAPSAQRVGSALGAMREAHRSLVGSLVTDFSDVGFRIEEMSAKEALHAIRSEVDSDVTSPDWLPSFPGDGSDLLRRARAPERGSVDADVSSLLWPNMERQLIPRGLTLRDARVVQIGGRLYMPMSVAMPPANLQPFDALFERLRESGVSYRFSFRLSGAGVEDTEIRMRSIFAMLSTSKTSKGSMAMARDDVARGASRIGLQIDVVVWVTDGDRSRLIRDASRIARAIQGWGGCEVDDRLGDPCAPVLGTVPGLLPMGYGTLSVPPMEDAVAMLPIGRPASPWATGSFLFRTPDGKIFPYQPYSAEQAAWVTLMYAPMRGGKSVLMAALNTALCMRAGLDRLPFIAILDIGPSSSGVISLIREALPPALQYQVVYRRMQMQSSQSINPCDTPLGMRHPLSAHRAFLVNLLSLLSTAIGEVAAPGDVPHLAGLCVDNTYKDYADNGHRARRYARIDPELDDLVDRHGIHWDVKSTYWEIVDALFAVGDIHGATAAQRYAMPMIGEIAAQARDPQVSGQFRGLAPNGEQVTEYFFRVVTQSVREYPVLATATRFTLGDARIVSLDLGDVAPKGGPTADRQTAVMYMLARHVLTQKFFVHTDDLSDTLSQAYREYHYREIQLIADDPKRICYDELHRTRSAPIVRQQIIQDIREGAKANLEIVLASQMLEDFDDQMIELATTMFVLGVGQLSLAETVSRFQLGSHASAVLGRLGKPTAAGARLLGVFSTRSGRYVAELMHTLSPTAIWAYGTTSEDRSVRDRLYREIGPANARRILALYFPEGSSKPEIERRRQEMGAEGGGNLEDAEASVIETLVSELVAAFGAQRD